MQLQKEQPTILSAFFILFIPFQLLLIQVLLTWVSFFFLGTKKN